MGTADQLVSNHSYSINCIVVHCYSIMLQGQHNVYMNKISPVEYSLSAVNSEHKNFRTNTEWFPSYL